MCTEPRQRPIYYSKQHHERYQHLPQPQPQSQQHKATNVNNNTNTNSSTENKSIETLNWRSEESRYNSDWAIQVTSSATRTVHTYHVHTSVLVAGPRKCVAIENFLQSLQTPPAFRTIPIELDERAAQLFPDFLDYIYSLPHFTLKTETVVGIRYLAQNFQVPSLQDATWQFIRKDMKLTNLEVYLQAATYFQDKQTASWVGFECAQNIMQIQPTSKVLNGLSPDDFKQTITLSRLCRTGTSCHSSELVAAYCSQHELDVKMFRELTSAENMPEISGNAASTLMQIEYVVKQRMNISKVSNLEKRCAKALLASPSMEQ